RSLAKRQVQLDALAGTEPRLGDNVRRVSRAADAVRGHVALTHLRMGAEDHLHRVGELQGEVELADLATAVVAQRLERLLHLRRYATEWTDDIPQEDEQSAAGAVQADGD